MFEFYEPLAQSKGVAIALDAPAPTPVLGDADLLREAVANLVDNAIKFTPEGGGVRVAAEVVGGRATVAVSDSGPGVAPQDREKVFRRFYRSEPSGPASGSGLGLSIAESIAKLHGFSLKVEDNAPGARFVLRDESRAGGVRETDHGDRAVAGAPRRRSEADAASSGSARRGEFGAGCGAQQVEVGRHRAQGEASLRRRLGAPPVHANRPANLPWAATRAAISTIARSTSASCGSTTSPRWSAIDRSLGPTNTPSTPGVARIASSEASASRVSIMAIASVNALALWR